MVSLPLMIILGVCTLSWFSYWCCCICEKNCPPFKVCIRNMKLKPFKGWEVNVPPLMASIFCILLIGIGVLGLTHAPQIQSILINIRC